MYGRAHDYNFLSVVIVNYSPLLILSYTHYIYENDLEEVNILVFIKILISIVLSGYFLYFRILRNHKIFREV